MAFFQLVIKARNVKNARQEYHEEKLRSIELAKGRKVPLTFGQRIRHLKVKFKQKILGVFKKCSCCPEESWMHKKLILLRTDGTLENYILKSLFGFIGGLLLTYIFFIFFVFHLHFRLAFATCLCAILGFILTLGLAFNPRIRCIVFLFLPQFFSRRGRQALIAYAFILALGGPAKNSLHNVAVLSESLSCCQEKLKEAVKAVIDLVREPFYALRDSLARIVKSIKAIVRRIRKTLIALKRLVLSILQIIKSVFDWLASIVSICNKNFGTPYDRCNAVFDGAVLDCRNRLGPIFGKLCEITYVASTVCVALKPLDLVCVMVSYVSDAIVGVLRKKLNQFTRQMRAMFYVKIKFSHHFHMETNKSRSFEDISSGISTEIKTRTERFLSLFDWAGFLTSFFFLILLLRVLYYRYKWLSSDRYDNHYISKHMREIDIRRARQDKETIFPLNRRERNKYANLGSILLIKSEKIRLAKSAVFLAITSTKLAIYMACDYCLFWVLDTVRYHGRTPTKIERPSLTDSVQVEGRGFLADIYRSIIRAFSPFEEIDEYEGVPCLPEPKPPDYDVYTQIASLVLFCWLMALFEPYGLRIRHVVLNSYYPDRAKQRAVWLYNQIIRSRGSFLKYARRQLRRKFGTAHGIERVTLRERIWAVCPLLNRIAPLKLKNACLVCGEPERDKDSPHIRCPTPGCLGVYCIQCFQELHKLCTICKSPLDYGDLTDISEERDSSEEEIDEARLEKIREEARRRGEALEQQKLSRDPKVTRVQRDSSDDDASSKYNYSYQEESPEDFAIPKKKRFKDVEAQEVRDDVTIHIFDEPLGKDLSSSSGGQITCFRFFRRKKSSKKQKRKKDDESSDSTSIADTESWTTEEIDEQEDNVLDIEIEDFDDQKNSEDELLPEVCSTKKYKKSRLLQAFSVFSKMFSTEKDKRSTCDEFVLSQLEDYKIRTSRKSPEVDYTHCICRKSSQAPTKSILKQEEKTYYHPHLLKFRTKEIPRHMEELCSNTKYYEIDESSSFYSPREKIEFQADFSTQTDSRSSVDSDPSRDRRSSTSDIDDNDSYIYTSENNENRYKTESQTSDSSVPEDIDFSELSTDFSDNRKISCLIRERISNDEGLLTEEEKINEDSDEKGQSRKEKSKKHKIYDSFANFKLFKRKGNLMNRVKTSGKKAKQKDSKETEKSSENETTKNKNSDTLKRDKVDKETANAKRKSSLTQKKSVAFEESTIKRKVDKSVGVQEIDLKRLSKRKKGGGEFFYSKRKDTGNVAEITHGFQPILSKLQPKTENTNESSRVAFKDERNTTEMSTLHISEIHDRPQTRDQSTYVRLKVKKSAAESFINPAYERSDDS